MPEIKSTLCGYTAYRESPKVIWSVYNVKPTMIKLQATKKSGRHEKNAFYAQSGGVSLQAVANQEKKCRDHLFERMALALLSKREIIYCRL